MTFTFQKGLLAGGLTFLFALIALVSFYFWASSGRYPRNRYAEIVNQEADAVTEKAGRDRSFTIVTYNIGYLSGLTNNLAVSRSRQLYDDNLAIAVKALKPLKADFIALQEIDLDSRRSFNVNQVEALAAGLDLPNRAIAVNWDKQYVPFPYWPPSAHFGHILSSQAILSRYPIQRHERIALAKVASKPFFYNAFYLDRLAQIAQINLDGQPLILVNVHMEAFDRATRSQQTDFVKQLTEQYLDRYPVLLLGDFNSPPPTADDPNPTIETLLAVPKLEPAFNVDDAKTPAPETFPADRPIAKLDYIFYSRDRIQSLEQRVITEAGQASDHLPVLLKFQLIR